ncbi:hypothetical protein BTI73_08565 [Lactobacillus delbrueckii subsp. bulgaricus]|nr:hypothetical protein [Lactobacillus delbrueckii subsp. bulgaricus]MBT8908194.1 hypothetical protein [Lactobacillus delbrueckii subsp. bulgaricus]
MKFDYIVGNPPYQEDSTNTSDKPVYDLFMDCAETIADKVELITPARFLFNAGKTNSKWNEKKLNDIHFKILQYYKNSSDVFAGTDITGGIAISYMDKLKKFEIIGTFTPYDELNSILQKVHRKSFISLATVIESSDIYKFTSEFHEKYPNAKTILSRGHENSLTSNVLEKLPFAFYKEKDDSKKLISIVGRQDNKRIKLWIEKEYIKDIRNLHGYKVILPKSNGSKPITDGIKTPVIGEPLKGYPNMGYTQTFISIGPFKTESEMENVFKYVKTKFCRALIGTLKITQHNATKTWLNVPIQNFTSSSDIDWSKSISDIDQQLYEKYNLSKDEISFIENHIKEMA